MSQLSRQFQGFKLQYPNANVSDFYGGLVIKDIQQQLNNLGIGFNTALTTLETIVNSLELSKVVGIKNIYTKNLLLNELKTYKNIKITPVLQGLNLNFKQREPNTSYQSRMDIVINQQDYFQDTDINTNVTYNLYRMWYPFLQKEYKLSSPTPPNWIQAKNDNVIRLNNQRLLYFGDLKGEWTVNTEYFVGDLVYVQSGYPSFMEMPQGQTQTFVFICLQEHTSSSETDYYQNFFRTDDDDDYIDNNGNHVFPILNRTVDDNYWEILRLNNGSCRQWWFWNNNTYSVTATLYTSEMLDKHYPTSTNTNDPYFLFQGTQMLSNNSSYSNSPHTLRQNNGIIVSIGGVLTLWASNWWKSQTVVTSSDSTLIFPVNPDDGLGFVEDGNEDTGKFLWVKFSSVAMNYDETQNYIKYPIITLPVNIDIQPHAKLFVSRYSNAVNKTLKVINLVSDIIIGQTFSEGDGIEDTTSKDTRTFTFDHNQGNWYNEDT